MGPRAVWLLGVLVVVGALLPSQAAAHGDPDQVNDVPTGMSVGCERDGQPLFQSFTPSVRLLAAVDLRMEPSMFRPQSGLPVVLRVVRGLSAGSQVIGTATAVTTDSFRPYLLHFDFTAPLALDPAGGYGLEVPSVSGVTWLQSESDSYPRGSSSACGIAHLTRDFLFRTLVPADEDAPETVVVKGPTGLVNNGVSTVRVRGEDDLTYPADLRYRCTLDGQPLSCTSSTQVRASDGTHRLAVAAIDKAGREDPTPATVEWSVDTRPPSRPIVRGPTTTAQRVAVYRFSSAAAVGFRCAVDRKPMRRCGNSVTLRLQPGTHVLRVQAVDAAGNQRTDDCPYPRRLSLTISHGTRGQPRLTAKPATSDTRK